MSLPCSSLRCLLSGAVSLESTLFWSLLQPAALLRTLVELSVSRSLARADRLFYCRTSMARGGAAQEELRRSPQALVHPVHREERSLHPARRGQTSGCSSFGLHLHLREAPQGESRCTSVLERQPRHREWRSRSSRFTATFVWHNAWTAGSISTRHTNSLLTGLTAPPTPPSSSPNPRSPQCRKSMARIKYILHERRTAAREAQAILRESRREGGAKQGSPEEKASDFMELEQDHDATRAQPEPVRA